MSIIEKLMHIQQELKAPKGQYNSFGKYAYRSCEDILESVKPILAKYGCALTLSDEIENVGDRFYVKATAVLHDTEDGGKTGNVAYAREDTDKKGMDGSQITGAASSYARKYALNGLFAIDDTKDADTDEMRKQTQAVKQQRAPKGDEASRLENAVHTVWASLMRLYGDDKDAATNYWNDYIAKDANSIEAMTQHYKAINAKLQLMSDGDNHA